MLGIRVYVRVVGLVFAVATGFCDLAGVEANAQPHSAPKVSGIANYAVELAFKGDFIRAAGLARRSGDGAAKKLVELLYLRDRPNEAGYRRIMAFLDTAPNWPLTEGLLKRAERALYVNREPAGLVLRHFTKRQPTTEQGSLAYARALLAVGDKKTALKYVKNAYYNPDIPSELEKQIVTEFAALLSIEDDRKRMWRLVYAHESNAAIRASKQLSEEYQKAAIVAQQLLRLGAAADKQYETLPSAMREEPGIKYALTWYYRKKADYPKARAILASVPGNANFMGDPEAWWIERRIVARHSLGKGHRDATQVGYKIASSHGLSTGEKAAEGEFLAGWIALRYLNHPAAGLRHFKRLGDLAETATEKARAGYWTGRALDALGQPGRAKAFYRDASKYSTVYYGQLAREKVGLNPIAEASAIGIASAPARTVIEKDEVVRAFRMVADLGHKNELPMFFEAFANRFKSVDEMNAVASLVWMEGGSYLTVRLAKTAAAKHVYIDAWNYPDRALPEWKEIGKPVERSLIYALARQESEFNPTAGSKVGAQGFMQIMPDTGKLVTKQYGLEYQDGILTNDPSFNVMLGAAHLGDLISNHRGCYVLALVSYNAGPRRSREWIAEYGDLRTGETDPVDWIESIPYPETRQYVQKVLQNLHVYRSRLSFTTVRPMTADLARGSTLGKLSVAASEPARSLSVKTIPAQLLGPVNNRTNVGAQPIFGGPVPN
jgi:soluble lytic murein transglycosylase